MQRICAKNNVGPKCPSVVPFKILHSEGPFEVASFEHFGLERPFNILSGTTIRWVFKSRPM